MPLAVGVRLLFKKYLYLFIWLRQVFVAAWAVLVVVCGIWFPDQGLNLGLLHWQHRVLGHWTSREVTNIDIDINRPTNLGALLIQSAILWLNYTGICSVLQPLHYQTTKISLFGDLLNPGYLLLAFQARGALELGMMNPFWHPGIIVSFSGPSQITPLFLFSPLAQCLKSPFSFLLKSRLAFPLSPTLQLIFCWNISKTTGTDSASHFSVGGI